MSEFRFTFVRGAPEREESHRCVNAVNMDAAVAEAESFCKSHDCQISHMEWFDDEAQRWRQSDVQYA